MDLNKKQDVPWIICGDFNIYKHDQVNYPGMIGILKVPDYELHGACLYTYDGLNYNLIARVTSVRTSLTTYFSKRTVSQPGKLRV